MRTSSILLALALVVPAAGCDGGETDPRSLLTEPRVLAVRATPPVAAPDGYVGLDALLVDGGGARADAPVTWRACDPWRFVLDPAADCAPDDALALPGGALDVAAVLSRYPPPDGVVPVPPATSDATSDETCGDELRLELPVIAEATVDGRRLVAVKRVPLALPTPDRTNPQLGELSLDGVAAADGYRSGTELEVAIAPLRDSLDPVCDAGESVLESVRIHLYATAGRLADPYVDVVFDANESSSAEVTTWATPDTGRALLWLVAIDGDGGTDWRMYELGL